MFLNYAMILRANPAVKTTAVVSFGSPSHFRAQLPRRFLGPNDYGRVWQILKLDFSKISSLLSMIEFKFNHIYLSLNGIGDTSWVFYSSF